MIAHNYSDLAGKTVLWDTSDSQENFEKNCANPATRKRLQELGYLDQPIEYVFNSHGFRTHEFDQPIDAVCFGCSFTMGTGVAAQDTWPVQLETLTGLQVANLGHSGSSNDTAFRFARHYLPVLKPRHAIWLQTDSHRLELMESGRSTSLNIMAGDTANPCANDYFIRHWFAEDANQTLNLNKNTMAFQYLCHSLGIKSVILGRDQVPTESFGQARDLAHPGTVFYADLAARIAALLD